MSPERSDASPPGAWTRPSPHASLREAVLDELLSHSHAAMRAMKRYPGGAISLVHLHVLHVLDVDGPQAMRALAASIDVSQSSTTGIVDRMEQRGLVCRERDETDRRVVRVELTEQGRGLLSGFATERREALGQLLDDLSERELDGLLRGARALRLARERRLAEQTATGAGSGA